MASQLTPTIITDKNGRITTVHKKNATVGKTKPIPALKRDYTAETMSAMRAMKLDEFSERAESNVSYLAEHHPKLLARIVDQCADDEMTRVTWSSAIQFKHLFSGKPPEDVRENIRACHGLLELYPVAARIARAEKQLIPGVIRMMVEDTLERTHYYHGGDWNPVRLNMLAERYVVEEDRHGVTFGYGNRLSEILDLIPELKKRGKVDEETLEMLLDSDATALREGEL